MPPDPAALAVSQVSHAFGPRQVLRDVSFSVAPGDFTILLGLNGAGKTTLFALITRLYAARQGSIAVFGHPIAREPRAALARMGVVFQQPTLDLDLTVEENLFYHAALHGFSRRAAAAPVAAELARVGLAERRRDRVRALSGGQRRRVELARALVHRPALLLLDEPTVGLDIESRGFLLRHVRGLCASERLGVLWATHLIDEAEAARVIILRQGEVRVDATSEQLAAQHGSLARAFETLNRAAADDAR